MVQVDHPHPASARAGRFAFPALVVSNVFLAFGPWMVRLADVGPVAAGFWRMALAAPLLLVFARAAGGMPMRRESALIVTIIVGGLFFAADLASWHSAILHTKLANATLFGNASSFLFPLYGFLILRQRPRGLQGWALALAAAGTALLLGRSYELSPRNVGGDMAALLAGLFYTLYLIAIDRARRTLAPMPVLALSTLASVPPLLVLALVLGETVVPRDWTPLLLLSLGSQVIGQGLLVYAMGYVRPIIVGLALLIQPAITAALGWHLYGELLAPADLLGILLICIAMVLVRLPVAPLHPS